MNTHQLLSQLKCYGLNPKDWQLFLRYVEPFKPLEVILQHREVEHLKLKGYCQMREGLHFLEFNSLSLVLS